MLAMLAGAFEAAVGGNSRTVLLGAEAGGGKSRLAQEFAARVGDRALVLAGGCVDMRVSGLPYAPFTAALRGLVRARGVTDVAALLPGHDSGGLAWLLPEFGGPPSGGDPDLTRARLFGLLLTLLEALADQRPLVVVLEDVHWGDQLTYDLLGFLVRNLRHARVLLVVTFRSDELDRRSPLRQWLAGLGRMEGVIRLELPRLSRDQVAVQLEGILGRPPGPVLTDAVHRRGGGLPLFTESLVSPDGTLSTGLPWSLRDLLLAAVKDLPGPAQEVLRVSAVGGPRVGHTLLAAVTGLGDAALTAALRPAVAAAVIVGDADGYAFRHELIREAVLEDLLVGERIPVHARFAAALAADPSLSPGTAAIQVAVHWQGAQQHERALAAAWQAAGEAGAAFAYAERLTMLEQVLDLWCQVPEPERIVGAGHAGVQELAADAARWAGMPERGLALAEAALAEIGEPEEPVRRASLLRRRAGLRRELLLAGQLDDLRAALRLVSAPTLARAQALAQLCWALLREDRTGEAALAADELDALARRLGDEEHQAEALLARAVLRAREGENTRAELEAAREAAVRIGSGRLEAWAFLHTTNTLEALGDHELAIRAGRDGLARARQLGLGRQLAATIAGNLAESLTSTGCWDEAVEILDELLRLDLPPLERSTLLLLRARIALARDDRKAALRILDELHALPAGRQAETDLVLPVAELEIGCRLAEGDLTCALAAVATVPACNLHAYPRYSWPLLATAMRACADAANAGVRRPASHPAKLREDLELRAAGVTRPSPLQHAHAATFAAESSRADGRNDRAGWEAAAAAWEAVGQPYPLAYTLFRGASAALADGSHAAAGSALRQAAGLAGHLDAKPLARQISQLARRARIALGDSGSGQGNTAPFGLTSRELGVLRLVAAGCSNPEIAAELFISPKTASVHVSNILSKLQVSSRGEAAAAAHRAHLFDAPDLDE
jgi:DNA-binding CsgD family transcriptional regulator